MTLHTKLENWEGQSPHVPKLVSVLNSQLSLRYYINEDFQIWMTEAYVPKELKKEYGEYQLYNKREVSCSSLVRFLPSMISILTAPVGLLSISTTNQIQNSVYKSYHVY